MVSNYEAVCIFPNRQHRQKAGCDSIRRCQAQTKNEFVGDREAAVVDRNYSFSPLSLIEQGTDFEAARLPQIQHLKDGGDCVPTVNNIFHQEYVLISNVGLQVKGDTHGAARLAPANPVGRDSHEIHHVRSCDVTA